MNMKFSLFFISIIILAGGCSYGSFTTSDLPIIDIVRNYPSKEIILTDIANVTYVHLDTGDGEFLYRGTINYITENTIVVKDHSSDSFLFFSKNGTPKSRFNRFGQGVEEYPQRGSGAIYDENDDEVFIFARNMNFIQVYSSAGKHKRRINLPVGVMISQMDFFDSQTLIVFDESARLQKALAAAAIIDLDDSMHLADSSFFLICKMNGQVLEYIQMPFTQIDLSVRAPGGPPMMAVFTDMVRHRDGFLLCNPAIDTVFLYCRNQQLTPILWKTPSNKDLDPKVILNNCIDTNHHQFFEIQTNNEADIGRPDRHRQYVRDKQTGRIYRQNITLPDYMGKRITIRPNHNNFFHQDGTHIEMDLIELKKAYRENRLNGELKKLVSTLNEFEDNNVFMLVEFR